MEVARTISFIHELQWKKQANNKIFTSWNKAFKTFIVPKKRLVKERYKFVKNTRRRRIYKLNSGIRNKLLKSGNIVEKFSEAKADCQFGQNAIPLAATIKAIR